MSQSEEKASGPLRLRREFGLRDLVLFNIAAVAGIRWLAATAHVGAGSTTLWILAALMFFVPSGLAVSSLSRRFPEEGGIYIWTKHAFGDWHGFLCGWCYWLSNVFFFPNLLLAGIAMSVYMLGARYAAFAENQAFLLTASLALLWIALLSNVAGLQLGKWIGNIGGMATYSAGVILALAGTLVWFRFGSATHLDLLPEFSWDKVNFWSQVAFAFGGLELGAIMGGEIRNPERNVPRAVWISGFTIAAFYIFGTLAILAVVPAKDVSILTGLAQAGNAAGQKLGMLWLSPLLALLITLGVAGQIGAWFAGSARIPFAIGIDCYLPPVFGQLHPRWKTPYVALLTQGLACTVFLFAMQLGENVRVGYQLLVDMTVITYFIPFLYLFGAAWRFGRPWSGASGLAVTLAGIAFSLVPPAEAASPRLFEAKLLGGCLLLIAAGRMGFQKGVRYLREHGARP